MLTSIIDYINAELSTDQLLNGHCNWSEVGESERIVKDLQNLYDRINGEGEYRL